MKGGWGEGKEEGDYVKGKSPRCHNPGSNIGPGMRRKGGFGRGRIKKGKGMVSPSPPSF
jgi:hypothetical protein